MSSSRAKCAKAIRTVLKENFKKTTFRVKSDSFGHSDSVNIYWKSGEVPCSEEVWECVKDFKSYRGMDVLGNTKWEYKDDIPQVDYVTYHETCYE